MDPQTVVGFDHTSPEHARATDEILRDLRARCPVAFTEQHGGYFVLSRYQDVAGSLRDEATFSSKHIPEPLDGVHYGGINIPEAPYFNVLAEMDPPEWNTFRRILTPTFSPPAIEKLIPHVHAFSTECIDDVIESGRIDFVDDLANPVPAKMTMLLLGLPLEDWRGYADPMHKLIFTRPGTPEFDEAVRGQEWMFEAMGRAVADRRANPTGDVLSEIVETEVDGYRPTEEEIVKLLFTVISGGVDTTTALLSNAVEYLDRHRDVRQRLIDDPELLPAATEEFLRHFTPVQNVARTIAKDVEIEGTQLCPGDRVLMSFASANFDDDEFPDADAFVLDRSPNRHVAFGMGKHRCIGAALARNEFQAMLEEVLNRMPDYEIDRSGIEQYPSKGIVNGWIHLPATFAPGTRSTG